MRKSDGFWSVVLVLMLIWLLYLMNGCRSVKQVSERQEAHVDSLWLMRQHVDSLTRLLVVRDSVLMNQQEVETAYHDRKERMDSVYRQFVEHYTDRSDSMAVRVDSLTGEVSYYYYTRIREREWLRDTLLMRITVTDTSAYSRELIEEYRNLSSQKDYLEHRVLESDSMYRALKDSVAVEERKVTKRHGLDLTVGIVGVILIIFGVIWGKIKE